MILLICVALIGFFLFLIFPGKMPGNSMPVLTSYAHRGLHRLDGTIVENSLAAFKAATEAGYGIELDLQLSKDGQVVVFHDKNLLRVCGIDKDICDWSYVQLKDCRLGASDETIPLFSQVLSLVAGRVPLLVELKDVGAWEELSQKTADLLAAYSGDYAIESFHPGIVRWFYKHKPLVVRGQLSAALKNFEGIPKWQGFLIANLLTNAATRPHFVVYKIEDINLALRIYRFLTGKVFVWTLRDQETLAKAKIGVEGVIFEFMRPEEEKFL